MSARVPETAPSCEMSSAQERTPPEVWIEALAYLSPRDLYLGAGHTDRAFRACAQKAATALAPPRYRSAAWGHVAAKARLLHSLRQRPLVLPGHQGPICGVALSADGRWAYSADASGAVRAFDLLQPPEAAPAGRLAPQGRRLVQTCLEPLIGMRLVSGDKYLLIASFNGVFVLDVEDESAAPRMLGQSRADAAFCVDVSRDGRHVVTGAGEGQLMLWRFGAWDGPAVVLQPPSSHASPPGMAYFLHCAMAPDASLAVGLHATGHCFLWRLDTPTPQAFYVGDKPCTTARISPNGRLLATGCIDGYVYLRETVSEAPFLPIVKHVWVHDRSASAIAFSPDGRLLAIGLESGDIYLWDFDAPGRPLGPHVGRHAESPVMSLCWAQDGQSLLSGVAETHAVRVWAKPSCV